jgi:hypothetical protein
MVVLDSIRSASGKVGMPADLTVEWPDLFYVSSKGDADSAVDNTRNAIEKSAVVSGPTTKFGCSEDG